MDRITFIIGITGLIVSMGIVFLSFTADFSNEKSKKKEIEKANLLKLEITELLAKFTEFGTEYHQNKQSKVQKEAIRLKFEAEQLLGIDAKSKVDNSTYEQPTGSFGVKAIKDDLIELNRQLDNLL